MLLTMIETMKVVDLCEPRKSEAVYLKWI